MMCPKKCLASAFLGYIFSPFVIGALLFLLPPCPTVVLTSLKLWLNFVYKYKMHTHFATTCLSVFLIFHQHSWSVSLFTVYPTATVAFTTDRKDLVTPTISTSVKGSV